MRLLALSLLFMLTTGCSSVNVQSPIDHYPVKSGEVGPVASNNPLQQPFSCATQSAGMGEPLIDNHLNKGQPVYGEWLFFDYKKGSSQYCGAPMQVSYFYRNTLEEFKPLSNIQIQSGVLPEDAVFLGDAEKVPFVVRLERGVINRFIYGVSGLASWPISIESSAPESSLLNKRLIMFFIGGISVGHQQSGGLSIKMLGDKAEENQHFISLFNPELLSKGYLLAGSSGMGTDTTYNIPLLGETAVMVKKQVVAEYGEPDFTLGVGGSGGAIQQIYNMKEHPSLLDGMVASHLFPDLLTQIPNVGDCELLEYYFDRGADSGLLPEGFWQTWSNRELIEGFNAEDGYFSRYSIDGTGIPLMANAQPGSSVCVDGWRGTTPIVFNPKMFLPFVENHQVWLKDEAAQLTETHWTHWDDAEEIYGLSDQGYANRTYDNNVGVQYGLSALKAGLISVDTFLDLNAKVGGWKDSSEMTYEYAPYYPYGAFVIDDLSLWSFASGNIKLNSFGQFIRGTQNLITLLPDSSVSPWVKRIFGRDDKQSVWSDHNATTSLGLDIAPRSKADPDAIQRAINAGLVFDGGWNKPSISLLVYLDPELDIHDARQSFVFRERMKKAGSDPSTFSIWGLMPSGNEQADEAQLNIMAVKAVISLDDWLSAGEKTLAAEDACWDEAYNLLDQGDQKVWEGVKGLQHSRDTEKGLCTQAFPIHSSPRGGAGEPFTSAYLKCPLWSVQKALDGGVYGHVSFSNAQIRYLKQIFPEGVCHY